MPIRIKLSFEPPFPPIRCLYAVKAKEVYIKNLKENIINDILSQSYLTKKNVELINLSSVRLSLDGFELVDTELAKDLIRNDDLISVEYIDEDKVERLTKKRKKILRDLSRKKKSKIGENNNQISDEDSSSESNSSNSSSSDSSSDSESSSSSQSSSNTSSSSDLSSSDDDSSSSSSSSSNSSSSSSSSEDSSSDSSSDNSIDYRKSNLIKNKENNIKLKNKKERKEDYNNNKNNKKNESNKNYDIKPPLSLGAHKKKLLKTMKNMKNTHVYFEDNKQVNNEDINNEDKKNKSQMLISYADLYDTPEQIVKGQEGKETKSKRKRRRSRGNKNKKNNNDNNNINNQSSDINNNSNNNNLNNNNSENNVNNENEIKEKSNDDNNPPSIINQNQKLNKGKEAEIDYSGLPSIGNYLDAGEKIVFKTLDMNSSWTPEISDYKEATVLSFNSLTKEATLKLDPQYISHSNDEVSEMYNNSKNPENDNIEVVVENIGYANQEIFTIKIDELLEAKKLN